MFLSLSLLVCVGLLTGCKQDVKSAERGPVKVVTEKVAATTLDGGQGFSGTVEEENGASLSFATAGTVSKIYVSEGQMVAQGALLAEVDPVTAQNAYDGALATREQAEDAYARMKQLHDAGSLPEIQWIEVQSKLKQAVAAEQIARKGLNDCKLYAPFGGFVAQKLVEVGQNAMPGVPVLKLVKIGQVKVKIAVPETEIASVRKGDKVAITVQALGGKKFEGTVAEKGVEANALSRSYDVKVAVANPQNELLPGMVCNAFLGEAASQQAIVLPSHVVLLDSDNRTFVWLNVGGKAVKRYVTIGEQTARGVVVSSGLAAGDAVITEGWQKVSEGMAVEG